MSAEVALLGRFILWINKDGIVRAGGDAGLTAYTYGLVEVDYAVRPLMHRRRWARCYTRRILALVTAGDLKRSAYVGEVTCIYVLHVRTCHRQWDLILGLTRSRASMAPNAPGVGNDFCPRGRCSGVGCSDGHTAGVVVLSRSIFRKYHSAAENHPKSLPH